MNNCKKKSRKNSFFYKVCNAKHGKIVWPCVVFTIMSSILDIIYDRKIGRTGMTILINFWSTLFQTIRNAYISLCIHILPSQMHFSGFNVKKSLWSTLLQSYVRTKLRLRYALIILSGLHPSHIQWRSSRGLLGEVYPQVTTMAQMRDMTNDLSPTWALHLHDHKYQRLRHSLTLVQLNCFNCIFLHLELKLLTQFPAPNEEKDLFFGKYATSKFSYLSDWASTTNYIIHFCDILFGLKSAWNRIYTGVAR